MDSNRVQENVFGSSDNGLLSITDEIFDFPETLLGPLINTTHDIRGELHKTDDDTILELKNFHYDGKYVSNRSSGLPQPIVSSQIPKHLPGAKVLYLILIFIYEKKQEQVQQHTFMWEKVEPKSETPTVLE